MISLKQQIKRELFRTEIQPIGRTNCKKINEIINDTISRYQLDNLPDGYIEDLLKKTELTMNENDSVMIKLNLIQVEVSLIIRTYTYQFIC